MKEEEKTYSLTPKGSIVVEAGYDNLELAEKINEGIKSYMERFDLAIVLVDGELTYVTLKESKSLLSKLKNLLK